MKQFKKIITYFLVFLLAFQNLPIQKTFAGIDTDVESYDKNLRSKIDQFEHLVKSVVGLEKDKLSYFIDSKIGLSIAYATDDYVQNVEERQAYFQEITKLKNNSNDLVNTMEKLESKELGSILPSVNLIKEFSSIEIYEILYNLERNLQNFDYYKNKIQRVDYSLSLIEKGILNICSNDSWSEYPYESFPPVLPKMPNYEATSFLDTDGINDLMAYIFVSSVGVQLLVYFVINHMSVAKLYSFAQSFISIVAQVLPKGLSVGFTLSVPIGEGATVAGSSAASTAASSTPAYFTPAVILIVAIVVTAVISYVYYAIKTSKAKKRIKRINQESEKSINEILSWYNQNYVKKEDVQNTIKGSCRRALEKGGLINRRLSFLQESNNEFSLDLEHEKSELKKLKERGLQVSNSFNKKKTDKNIKDFISIVEKKNELRLKTEKAYDIYKKELVSPLGMIKMIGTYAGSCVKLDEKIEAYLSYISSIKEKILVFKNSENENDPIWRKVDETASRHFQYLNMKLNSCQGLNSIIEGEL